MKTALTLLASGFLAASAMAQPSFTSVPVPTNGDKASKTIDYAGANPSASAGANKTWDYSALDYSAATDNQRKDHTDPSTAAHLSDFPSATWYAVSQQGSGDPFESYYQITSDKYNYLGFNGNGLSVAYSDPELIYSVPFLYGETQNDTYAYTYEQYGFNFVGNGSTSTVFDAYGTLITPYGTITDVPRWKTTEHSDLVITDQLNASNVTHYVTDITEYIWILPGDTYPMFVIYYVNSTKDGDPYESSTTAEVTIPSTATGIMQNTMASNALLYPQPAIGEVTMRADNLQGDCNIKVYNLSGDLVTEQKQFADTEKVTVDIQGLTTGMYMLELLNGDRTYRKKLVVR